MKPILAVLLLAASTQAFAAFDYDMWERDFDKAKSVDQCVRIYERMTTTACYNKTCYSKAIEFRDSCYDTVKQLHEEEKADQQRALYEQTDIYNAISNTERWNKTGISEIYLSCTDSAGKTVQVYMMGRKDLSADYGKVDNMFFHITETSQDFTGILYYNPLLKFTINRTTGAMSYQVGQGQFRWFGCQKAPPPPPKKF